MALNPFSNLTNPNLGPNQYTELLSEIIFSRGPRVEGGVSNVANSVENQHPGVTTPTRTEQVPAADSTPTTGREIKANVVAGQASYTVMTEIERKQAELDELSRIAKREAA